MVQKELKRGDRITCILCGGDGYVSEETAAMYGGCGCECPSCGGSGKVVYHPLPKAASNDPRDTDWVCLCGKRNRRSHRYCVMCATPQSKGSVNG